MTFKIAAYGVRENEIAYFNKLNKYDYELTLLADNLTHDNVDTAKGHDAVLIRANNVADAQNLATLAEYGIKYVFTRTVAYSHIDLAAAKANGQTVAYVPSYSPYAVGELAFTLALMQQRHTTMAAANAAKGQFQVLPGMFATELHDLTVGIIGTGRIGRAEAELWRGVGATVLGYDVYENEDAKALLTYATEEELLAKSDIVSLHVPHFPGKNDAYFNADYVSKMKDGAILVNTARAEITDQDAILAAVESGKLNGFATDVVSQERLFFGKDFKGESTGNATVDKMMALYPQVIVTPHMGSYTEEALTDMISISFDNFNDVLMTGTSRNVVESN